MATIDEVELDQEERLTILAKAVLELETTLALQKGILEAHERAFKAHQAMLDSLASNTAEQFNVLSASLDEHIHSNKTIRRRIHASTSVKGVKRIEHTVEGNGYTLEEELAEWDAQDAAVEARQPGGSE